ncbi:MAG: right-handed parallel beta-helix repeat-containing protein, partial [Melioribacteraceae bacterium]|nr:right-handed parallel beta-helix repeat-containing protein [Melioribacteraceae bacterium]
QFTPKDGGERVETNLPSGAFEYHKLKDYFVTYAAYPGEHPIISGGKELLSWKKDGKNWVADAENINVKKLILDGKGQTLARTPNSGYFTFPTASKNSTSFSFNPGEIKDWTNMEDNRIKMYLRWHYGINSISKVDETKNMAYLKKPQDGILVISPRYYIENVKALLDSPGEWFYDKHSQKVFLIPPKDINPNNVQAVVPILQTLVTIEGDQKRPVRNLRFYGLSFEATESDSCVISFKYANKCEVVESSISEVGGSGIDVGYGAFQTRILNNKIVRAVGGGIRVRGNSYPSDWSEIIRETTISYNYIAECGSNTIHASNSLYTTISHNEITNNLGRYPIYVGGWSNYEEAIDGGYTVEYNHVHHVQSLADDSGVITSGGYTYNSVIRGNLIHHVSKGEFNDNVALWFDNMPYGWKAEDNIYYALEQGEMKLCAANLVDNLYQNNYKIETPKIAPVGIISGQPNFEFHKIKIGSIDAKSKTNFNTGDFAKVST